MRETQGPGPRTDNKLATDGGLKYRRMNMSNMYSPDTEYLCVGQSYRNNSLGGGIMSRKCRPSL